MHETGSFKYQFPPIVLPKDEAEFRRVFFSRYFAVDNGAKGASLTSINFLAHFFSAGGQCMKPVPSSINSRPSSFREAEAEPIYMSKANLPITVY